MYFCSLGSASLALGGQTRAAFPKGTEIENYASEGIMNKMNTMSGLLAVRLTTVLNNHFRIQITPEFDFGIYEDDNFKSVKGIDDQLKSWTTGLNLNVGLQVFF